MRKTAFLLLVLAVLPFSAARAEEIVLKNGDRLQVEILEESLETVKVRHEVLGDMMIRRTHLTSVSRERGSPPAGEKMVPEKGELVLDRRLGAGYEAKRGNTDTDALRGDFLYNRNRRWIDEWTVKGRGTQEYNQDKKTTQRADASIRYARSFNKKLYHFYRVGGEHDRFENIDLRLTPTAGPGYWIWDREDLKLLAETGIGYEYEFRRQAEDDGALIGHFRESFSKKIGSSIEFGEDVYFFPHLTEFSDYRLEGEVYLRFILTRHLAFKLKASDQYRSEPLEGKKKNDLQFTSTIEWLF